MNFNPEQGAPQAVLVDKSFTDQAQVDASKAQVEQAANLVASSEAVTLARADTDETRKVRMTAEMVQDSANYALDQVPSYKAEARAKLSLRLNTILATRDSVSGLIVSISDMEFEAEQSSLTPGARETLARVAIILAAYPGLNIAVCGYADNAGGDSMNQKLSENRADSVRDYLVKDGVGAQSVSTRCFDDNDAVASNDSSAGRQENRRVELVVSGDLIGDTANVTVGSLR
jgi:outer membrane protein OmpA-like peptidoglycan-associated protein